MLLVEVRDDKAAVLVVHHFHKNTESLFASEGEDHWRQRDLISLAEIGLAAIKGLLTHTFIML